jgi:hypothetical protein
MALLSGLVNRTKPAKIADGVNVAVRQGRYGEQMVVPVTSGTYAIADEGSYFKATNPTFGTGVAAAITTAFSATAGYFCLFNGDSAGGKRIYLDYLTMICNTVPATATSFQFGITLDSINRWSSAGSAITPVNSNQDDATSAIGVLHAGALVLAAASGSVRSHSRGVFFGAIPVVQSSYTLNFGTFDNQSGTLGGTVASQISDGCGPVVLGPGQSLNFHTWWPGNATTAGVWEFELGWWER